MAEKSTGQRKPVTVAGTINSAKLDGSDAKELKKIKAVPMGIAVDTAGEKLYWTNSRGRIQSADLDGSGIENVIPGEDLEGVRWISPVARVAMLYWTEGTTQRPVCESSEVAKTTGVGLRSISATGSGYAAGSHRDWSWE